MADLVFWQEIVSPHQAHFIAALAREWQKTSGGGTYLLCEQRMLPSRRKEGWEAPGVDGVEILCLDEGRSFEELAFRFFGRGVTHVCTGFHAIPLVWQALRAATQRGERTFVMLEYPRSSARTHLLRKALYGMHAFRFSGRLQGLLAFGEIGADYYRSVGFPRERVHPIGYTVVAGSKLACFEPPPGTRVKLLFVGSQLHRKGLDLLLAAVADPIIRDGDVGDWQLTIVSADDTAAYQSLAAERGLSARIHWRGAMPNAQVRELIARSDVLVLPSRRDGWGAVVNEALHAGARVIVSDRCGASCVVGDGLVGSVFPSQNVSALRAKLVEAIGRGPLAVAERDRIATWAEAAISPDAMARYVMSILTRPDGLRRPPWIPEVPICTTEDEAAA